MDTRKSDLQFFREYLLANPDACFMSLDSTYCPIAQAFDCEATEEKLTFEGGSDYGGSERPTAPWQKRFIDRVDGLYGGGDLDGVDALAVLDNVLRELEDESLAQVTLA